jgi:hypothetical protein
MRAMHASPSDCTRSNSFYHKNNTGMRFIVSLHCSVGDANGRECVLKKKVFILFLKTSEIQI